MQRNSADGQKSITRKEVGQQKKNAEMQKRCGPEQ